MAKIHNWAKEIQVEIIAGCSDARDVSSAFNQVREDVVEQYRKDGTLVDTPRLSIPGVFATHEVISEIKTLIFDKQKEYYQYSLKGVPVEFMVHMMAHGNALLKEGHSHKGYSYHDIEIKAAKYNCGMMGAKNLALELEGMLLREKPTVIYGINSKKNHLPITSEIDIENLMKEAYGHNGTIAGNWVKSIENLATHPYEQKKIVRYSFDNDPALKNLRIHITAGVQNYGTNDYFRVDGNTQLHTALDDIYSEMRRRGETKDHVHRVENQAPEFLLFHHSGIKNARATAANYVSGSENYSAGKVFAIGGSNAADYFRFFGPYKTIGFYYAGHPHHLNLKTWVVMGKNKEEADMMETRLHNDPLVSFVINRFNIKIEKIAVDKRQSFPHKNENHAKDTAKKTHKH